MLSPDLEGGKTFRFGTPFLPGGQLAKVIQSRAQARLFSRQHIDLRDNIREPEPNGSFSSTGVLRAGA
jgi:hypothetical protein